MSEQIKVLKVFVASPNDLAEERRAIRDVAEDLSKVFENTVGLRIQLLGWEDTMPGCGRPQALINQDVDKAGTLLLQRSVLLGSGHKCQEAVACGLQTRSPRFPQVTTEHQRNNPQTNPLTVVGEAWTAFTELVLSGDESSAVAGTAKADARWAVRAAIDAVVAHAYGLTRDLYAHVLNTFSHSSYKDAPRQCLATFGELQQTSLEVFTQKRAPYWNIPLHENLPQPVIDLPRAGNSEIRNPKSAPFPPANFSTFKPRPPRSAAARCSRNPVAVRKRTRKRY